MSNILSLEAIKIILDNMAIKPYHDCWPLPQRIDEDDLRDLCETAIEYYRRWQAAETERDGLLIAYKAK